MNAPNYRIYSQVCDDGGTEDICAGNLAEAIAAGRAWIEKGEWGSDDDVYRTLALECCVRKIVYAPDPSGEEVIDDECRERVVTASDCIELIRNLGAAPTALPVEPAPESKA